jgi:chitodextrinase
MTTPSITSIVTFSGTTSRSYSSSSVVTLGSTIDFELTFNEVLSISGIPTLLLSNGATATYTGLAPTVGTGANATNGAYFAYVPGPNDANAAPLSVTEVYLNGGTISDANHAVPSLSVTGTAQIVPTLDIPSILSITDSTPGGRLTVGQTETITLGYNEAVTVRGTTTPTLSLNDGGIATYLSGSGSAALSFLYRVGTADLSVPFLHVTGVNANGATLTDANGIAAQTSITGLNQSGPSVGTLSAGSFSGDVSFVGTSSFNWSGANVTLNTPTIENLSTVSTTGPLTLTLWFFPNGPYTGTAQAGYEVAGYVLPSPLAVGFEYAPFSQTVPLVEPPIGTYDVALLLEENSGLSTQVDAWVNYSAPAIDTFGTDSDQSLAPNFNLINHVDNGDGDGGGQAEGEGDNGDGNGDNSGSSTNGNEANGGGSTSSAPTAPLLFVGPSTLTVTSGDTFVIALPEVEFPVGNAAKTYVATATLDVFAPGTPDLQYDLLTQLVGTFSTPGQTIAPQVASFQAADVTIDALALTNSLPTGALDAQLLLGDNYGDHLNSALNYNGSIVYNGNGNFSSASLSTESIPSTPAGLTATATTSRGTTLNWTASTVTGGTVMDYLVYENGNVVGTTTATSFAASGLAPSSTYGFTVAAEDATADSARSTTLDVTTLLSVPNAPTGLVSSATTSNSASLAWQPAAIPGGGTVTGYIVFENGNSIATTGSTNYVATGLAALTQYGFTVEALDAAGTSAPSGMLSVTTAVGPPTAPAGLSATSATSGITLSWQPASVPGGTVTGYVIYENGTSIATTGATSFTVVGLTPTTTFNFSVAALDASGASPQSSAIAVTTPAIAAPSPNALPALSGVLSPIANTALQQVVAAIDPAGTTIDDVSVASGSTTIPATTGALNVQSLLNAAANSSARLASGYKAGYLLGGGPATLGDASGNDLLVTVAAQSTLLGSNNDTLIGGNGNNTFVTGGTAGTVVGGTGANTIFMTAANSAITSQGADTIIGGAGSATVSLSGTALYFAGGGANVVGGSGGGTIIGGGSGTTINGGAASELIFGGSSLVYNGGTGAATIIGGGAGNTVTGGGGNLLLFASSSMTYVGGSEAATVIGGGGPLNVMLGTGGGIVYGSPGGNDTIASGTGPAILVGGGPDDQLYSTGSSNDTLVAGGGAETLNGAGSSGALVLFGGPGPDVENGGTGSNLFIAESGNETLTGGGSSDSFVFIATPGTGRTDVITNFNPNTDAIGLFGYGDEPGADAAALASATVSGNLTTVSLSDGTTIQFVGAPVLSNYNFF